MILDGKIEKNSPTWSVMTGDPKELADMSSVYKGGVIAPTDLEDLQEMYGLRERQVGMMLRRAGKAIGYLIYKIRKQESAESELHIDYVEILETERNAEMLNSIFELVSETARKEHVQYVSWFPMTSKGDRISEQVHALSDSSNNDTRISIEVFTRDALLNAMREHRGEETSE